MAIVGKFFGAVIAARLTGFGWRASAVIGTLMNTRGLTELIVLNLALEKGVISDALFAMLVLMALVTTFMAGPLLKLLDPKNELRRAGRGGARGRPRAVAAEFPELVGAGEARSSSRRRARTATAQLLALAEPLAQSEPPRELDPRAAGAARPGRSAQRRAADGEQAARARRPTRSRSRGSS